MKARVGAFSTIGCSAVNIGPRLAQLMTRVRQQQTVSLRGSKERGRRETNYKFACTALTSLVKISKKYDGMKVAAESRAAESRAAESRAAESRAADSHVATDVLQIETASLARDASEAAQWRTTPAAVVVSSKKTPPANAIRLSNSLDSLSTDFFAQGLKRIIKKTLT
jgi:hypothetical protein